PQLPDLPPGAWARPPLSLLRRPRPAPARGPGEAESVSRGLPTEVVPGWRDLRLGNASGTVRRVPDERHLGGAARDRRRGARRRRRRSQRPAHRRRALGRDARRAPGRRDTARWRRLVARGLRRLRGGARRADAPAALLRRRRHDVERGLPPGRARSPAEATGRRASSTGSPSTGARVPTTAPVTRRSPTTRVTACGSSPPSRSWTRSIRLRAGRSWSAGRPTVSTGAAPRRPSRRAR